MTWPSCQIDRSPSRTRPGISASSVVFSAQVAPIVEAAVPTQVTGISSSVSTIVPFSSSPGPLALSVIRTDARASSLPV